MLRSFFTITLRILWRNKILSFINIISLTIGITAFIIIMLYVYQEFRYDKFNKKIDRIYRIEANDRVTLPGNFAEEITDNIPEVQQSVRFIRAIEKDIIYKPDKNVDNEKEINLQFYIVDSTIFKIFTIHFIEGNPETALNDPFNVVLTASSARKIFGEDDPLGKTLEFNKNNYIVSGIIKDVKNSHLNIKGALFSRAALKFIIPGVDFTNREVTYRDGFWSSTYLLFSKDFNKTKAENDINQLFYRLESTISNEFNLKRFTLYPLKDLYFKGPAKNDMDGFKYGNIKLIRVLIIIAFLVLSMACINYVNLTIARSSMRLKEIAVKKVTGSSNNLLRFQFILESILLTIVACILSFTLIQIFLPYLNHQGNIVIDLDIFKNASTWFVTLSGVFLIGILSGVYPSLFLTGIISVNLIRGKMIKEAGGVLFRRLLMTFQFIISIILIICLITVFRQVHYAQTVNLGFSKNHVMTFWTNGSINERQVLRQKLLSDPDIENVSYSTLLFGHDPVSSYGTININGIKRPSPFVSFIDPEFIDLYHLRIIEGRNFSRSRISDREQYTDGIWKYSIIINKTAAEKLFGQQSVLGKIFNVSNTSTNIQCKIIGVVNDFNFQSIHEKIKPIMLAWTLPQPMVNIKIASGNISAAVNFILKQYENVFGLKVRQYKFVDQIVDRMYRKDRQTAMLISYFAYLAMVIACLGLFALSSFMVARRIKEIGIRKSMGASVGSIYFMLSWDFLKWIFLSVFIASPIAWFIMGKWLQTFAYHIRFRFSIFMMAALIAILIALFTITWQSIRTARANPVDALRYE